MSITPVEKAQLSLLSHIAVSLNYLVSKPPIDHSSEHEQLRLEHSQQLIQLTKHVVSLMEGSGMPS